MRQVPYMRTALIIDDDDRCRTPVAERLRAEGWKVVEAATGDEGQRLAVEQTPALLICSLLLPGGNGFQLFRAVRQQLDLRYTYIVAVSTRDYAADREMASEAGANEFVLRENLVRDLESILQRVPERSTPPEADGRCAREEEQQGTVMRFWGVRGSIPTPGPSTVRYGGNTSCLEVRADGEIIVLDAGTGIRPLGLALAEEFQDRPLSLTVLISHTHWDHIQGFPFFLPAYNSNNRLRILGYEGARAGLGTTLAGQMESPYFPIALKQMPGHIVIEELREMQFQVGTIRVEACFSKHPGVCVGYRLFTQAGSIVYVPDNEWSAEDEVDECGERCTKNERMVNFIRQAEVLVIDAQYDQAEYESHKGWGHGCVDDVVRLAIAAEVQKLYLFHHDPAHDDARVDALLEHARGLVRAHGKTNLQVFAACEGEQVRLGRKEAHT
jgi:phosphoribosyl 1,2-cyclic phosphodiesterase/CheY-like chemotaxis protein